MKIIARNILAIVVGLILGSMANMMIILAGSQVIPPPNGVNMSNMESLTANDHLLTPWHFLFPFLAQAIGTLVGASLTSLCAATRRRALAYTIGGLFLAGGIAASFMIPAPAWFIALDLLVAYIPMAWLGTRLGRGLRPGNISSAS